MANFEALPRQEDATIAMPAINVHPPEVVHAAVHVLNEPL